jgi:hypothetical protein
VDPIQLITVGGAAGVAVWVLKLVTDGKLHSSSETDGLRQDKVELLKINETQGKALRAANEGLSEVARLLRDVLAELRREAPDGDPP